MDSFPIEVLQIIFKCLTSIRDVKALRLNSSKLAVAGSRRLFHEVVLFPTYDSYDRASRIISRPDLSCLVKCIRYYPQVLSEMFSFYNYRRSVTGQRCVGTAVAVFGFDSETSYLNKSLEELKDGWLMHRSMLADQEDLFDHAETYLTRMFLGFPNLITLRIEGLQNFTYCNHSGDLASFMQNRPETIQQIAWQTHLILLYDSEDSIYRIFFNKDRLPSIVRALASSSTKLASLYVPYNLNSLIYNDTLTNIAQLRDNSIFASIRYLDLTLFEGDPLKQFGWQSSRVLEECTALTHLSVGVGTRLPMQSSDIDPPFLHGTAFFRSQHWPNLHFLQLSHLKLEDGNFRALLHRHKNTLQVLSLQDIRLGHQQDHNSHVWSDVFTKLSGKLVERKPSPKASCVQGRRAGADVIGLLALGDVGGYAARKVVVGEHVPLLVGLTATTASAARATRPAVPEKWRHHKRKAARMRSHSRVKALKLRGGVKSETEKRENQVYMRKELGAFKAALAGYNSKVKALEEPTLCQLPVWIGFEGNVAIDAISTDGKLGRIYKPLHKAQIESGCMGLRDGDVDHFVGHPENYDDPTEGKQPAAPESDGTSSPDVHNVTTTNADVSEHKQVEEEPLTAIGTH
ncbi:hypothetical protein MMC13_000238 [Lambiella insularis]|nr:hypothetical protein [Lambiella insularis]